mgnify:CR=1 FL=1
MSLPRHIIYATVREKAGVTQHEAGGSEHEDCCGSTPIRPVPSLSLSSSSAEESMRWPLSRCEFCLLWGGRGGKGKSVHTKELVSYEQKEQKKQLLFTAQLFEKRESRTDFQ